MTTKFTTSVSGQGTPRVIDPFDFAARGWRKTNFIYCRAGVRNILTLPLTTQINTCRAFIDGSELAKEAFLLLVDRPASGDHKDRPAYKRLTILAEADEIGVLVVVNLSRLHRGGRSIELIDQIVIRGGRVIAIQDGIDTVKAWN